MNHLPTYRDDEDDWYAGVIFAAFWILLVVIVSVLALVSAIFKWHLFTFFSL